MGSPQGTIGIPFDQLYEFFNVLCEYDMTAGKALQQEYKDRMAEASQRPRKPNHDDVRAAVDHATSHRPRTISESDVAVYRKVRTIIEKCVKPRTQQFEPGELEKLKGLLHLFLQYARDSTTFEGTTL